MKPSFRQLALMGVAAAGIAAFTAQSANAAVIQLGFILDDSGSIGSGNFTTIKTGLANAIGSLIPVGGANTYEISVVRFSTSAVTEVNHVLVSTAADRTGVVNSINAMSYSAGNTNFAAAFSAMQTVLTSSSNFSKAGTSYVNFATDGQPNLGGSGNITDDQAGINARNALITAGIDNISIEGIGSGIDVTYLQNSICYPGPCDATLPYNFPTQGFYIPVATAADYSGAISLKIQTVVNAPEPATLAVLGMGMIGLGLVKRRKA